MPDTFEAHIALQRWRADLHDLAGKPDAADLCRSVADQEVEYEDAKRASKAAPDDVMLRRRYKRLGALLHEDRAFWRGMRGDAPTAALNDFAEPSDDDLLGGV